MPMPPHLARPRGCVPAIRSFPLPFNFEPSTINRLFGFSPFNFELSTFNSFSLRPFSATLTRIPHSRRKTPRVSPFFASLTSFLQLTENTATLSPFAATLTDSVNHNPFVCHSYRKHRGWGLPPSSQVFSFCNLTTRHSLLSTISFVIRTSAERARNSRRICTSKTQDLKPFRIRTYEKTPGGPPSVTSSAQRPYSLARGGQQVIQQAFAAGRDNGPGAQALVHCLAHGGSHLEQIRHPQLSGRAHPEVPKVSVSLTNHKTKASKTCSRDSW